MSGVTGNSPIQGRKNFVKILKQYTVILKKFPGFKSVDTSGSYNSNMGKKTFGDMDLVVYIDGKKYDNDKKKIKADLAKFLLKNKQMVPFESGRYAGRRYYNSGEIITVSFDHKQKDITACQIDNIIAMDASESKFKKLFLDMPAAKQGLVLAASKVALIEQSRSKVLRSLGIKEPPLEANQEIEFNLSSTEIQLRRITYDPKLFETGKYREKKREVVWKSRSWEDLNKILYSLDLELPFEELLTTLKSKFHSRRASVRMKGVFKSMISIKSGEVGKQKGKDKQKALDLVDRIMTENINFKGFLNEKL